MIERSEYQLSFLQESILPRISTITPSGTFFTIVDMLIRIFRSLVSGQTRSKIHSPSFCTLAINGGFPRSHGIRFPAKAAFLKGLKDFDNISFGVSARDARVMPYGLRRLIEVGFRALQDSGIQSRNESVGCFVSGNNDIETQVSLIFIVP